MNDIVVAEADGAGEEEGLQEQGNGVGWGKLGRPRRSSTECSVSSASNDGRPLPEDTPLLILYGSQKGNAESIAKRVEADAVGLGFPVELASGNQYRKLKPPLVERKRGHVIIVTSTTGNGDPPDNFDR